MRRRGRPLVGLDQADLVLVAAEVLAEDPDDVVATADVAVLSGIASRLPEIPDLARAGAEVLVAVAAGRPFGRDDEAVAWLATVILVERNGHTIDEDDDRWVRLVRSAADGSVAEQEVTDALAPALRRRAGRVRRLAAAAWAPREVPVPSAYPCPVCTEEVERTALWMFASCAVPTRIELVAACARVRGTHDRQGSPVPRSAPERPVGWCPVVRGDDGATVPFVALTDRGPRAFRPLDGGRAYAVLAIDDLAPSDLVGSRSGRWDQGRVVGRVPATACVVDDRSRIDWRRVADALTTEELVTA